MTIPAAALERALAPAAAIQAAVSAGLFPDGQIEGRESPSRPTGCPADYLCRFLSPA